MAIPLVHLRSYLLGFPAMTPITHSRVVEKSREVNEKCQRITSAPQPLFYCFRYGLARRGL